MTLIQRDDLIRNNIYDTKTKIKACCGVRKELIELLKVEKQLAKNYEEGKVRYMVHIIRRELIPLIETALKKTVISYKVDEQ